MLLQLAADDLVFDLGVNLIVNRSTAFVVDEYVHVITSMLKLYINS